MEDKQFIMYQIVGKSCDPGVQERGGRESDLRSITHTATSGAAIKKACLRILTA